MATDHLFLRSHGRIGLFRILALCIACIAGLSVKAQPSAPLGLLASSASGKEVNLRWTDRSSDETGFKVERKKFGSKEEFVEIASVKADVCAYMDTKVEARSAYVYRVRSFNALGQSTFAEVAVKAGGAPPPPPANKKIPEWKIPAQAERIKTCLRSIGGRTYGNPDERANPSDAGRMRRNCRKVFRLNKLE